MEGTILGNRYNIIEKIGSGGMACVYKAKCQLLNRYVAVKVLKPEFTDDEEFVKRFRIEAQAAASLSHPNIVSVYDVGREGDIHYIVMEYIDGVTLNNYIKQKKKLDWKEAVRITIQICSAIELAHNNYVIHRDIKPQNIMLTRDGRVKVTDFGIARAATSATITMAGNTMGSVHYFSPEQARGGYVDEKSDLYSIGIVFYEMVTGKLPFDGEAPVTIALKHLQSEPKLPSELIPRLPRGINDIIMKAMQKDVKKRYQAASDMLADLYNVLENPDYKVTDEPGTNTMNTRRMEAIDIKDFHEKEGSKIGKRGKKGRRRDKTVIVAILLSVVIIAGFTYMGYKIVFPELIGPVEEGKFEVGNYVGKNINDVEPELKKNGITVIIRSEYNEEYEKDIIYDQSVPPGQTFKKGGLGGGYAEIELYVSLGEELLTIPDFKNNDYREAEKQLREMHIKFRTISEYSDTVPVNMVIDTDPGATTSINPKETEVVIIKSLGPKKELVKVPEVIGKNLEEATAILEENKLTVGELVPNNEISRIALIKEQYPQQGYDVEEGSAVKLVFDIETAVAEVPYDIELTDPDQYDDDDYLKLYVEASPANKNDYDMVYNQILRKSDFPVTITVPVQVNSYTHVRVLLNNKLYMSINLEYKPQNGSED